MYHQAILTRSSGPEIFPLTNHLIIHPFIQQTFIKHLLCSKHCPRHKGYSSDQNRPKSYCVVKMLVLEMENKEDNNAEIYNTLYSDKC